MTADELRALAARVEAATEPDRELDIEVALASGWERKWESCVFSGRCGWWLRRPGGSWTWASDANTPPLYTASIDAALTLVPKGWKWSLHSEDDQGRPTAYCVPNMGKLPWPSWVEDIQAATPALALTAAALRARAEEAGDV